MGRLKNGWVDGKTDREMLGRIFLAGKGGRRVRWLVKACNGIALPLLLTKGRDSLIGTATRYDLDVPGIESR